MSVAYLTIGPSGAGKSHWCRQAIARHPEACLVSRDEIMVELLGRASFDGYSGEHLVVIDRMWQQVAQALAGDSCVLLLDCWNGYAQERQAMTRRLRELGAERVFGLHFVTPFDRARQQYLEREIKSDWSDWKKEMWLESFAQNYRHYWDQPVGLDQGFDALRRIDPFGPQLELPEMPYLCSTSWLQLSWLEPGVEACDIMDI